MLVFDSYHGSRVETALDVAAISSSTTTNGNIIDTAGFEALLFAFVSGTITDGAYTVQLWHGDDSGLSDAAQVGADEVLGSVDFAAADDDASKRIGYIGKKRYVQVRVVSSGVTTGGTLGAIGILSTAHHAPVANQ